MGKPLVRETRLMEERYMVIKTGQRSEQRSTDKISVRKEVTKR